jgi:hypothetical protein
LGQISKNLVGVAGEYYVCAELCRQGILALITPKNNPLYDIVAADPLGSRSVSIQVKTMSLQNKQGWRLNKDICVKRNDYYIYERDDLAQRISCLYSDYMKKPKRMVRSVRMWNLDGLIFDTSQMTITAGATNGSCYVLWSKDYLRIRLRNPMLL